MIILFLYSQDLSNCTTYKRLSTIIIKFLYSQDLSNCTTWEDISDFVPLVFVLSRFK